MKGAIFLFCILITSCVMTGKRFIYSHYEHRNGEQVKVKYSIVLPKGYRRMYYLAGGEAGREVRFIYPDSSIFYIADFGSELNGDNFNKDSLRLASNRLEPNQNDTFRVNGIDKRGLHWASIQLKTVEFGYLKAGTVKATFFDKATLSIKRH